MDWLSGIYKSDEGILFDRLYVISTATALARAGLTTVDPRFLNVFWENKKLGSGDFGLARFVYREHVDYEHYLTPVKNNPHLLMPTKERAIVDSIISIEECPEGDLIEAIKTYLRLFGTVEALEEVADVLGLSRDVLHYWIKEALEDEEE